MGINMPNYFKHIRNMETCLKILILLFWEWEKENAGKCVRNMETCLKLSILLFCEWECENVGSVCTYLSELLNFAMLELLGFCIF